MVVIGGASVRKLVVKLGYASDLSWPRVPDRAFAATRREAKSAQLGPFNRAATLAAARLLWGQAARDSASLPAGTCRGQSGSVTARQTA